MYSSSNLHRDCQRIPTHKNCRSAVLRPRTSISNMLHRCPVGPSPCQQPQEQQAVQATAHGPPDIPRSEGLRGFWRSSVSLQPSLGSGLSGFRALGSGRGNHRLMTQRSLGVREGSGVRSSGLLTVFEAVRSMEAAHGHRTSSSLLTAIVYCPPRPYPA